MTMVSDFSDWQRINPFVPSAPFLYLLKTSEEVSLYKTVWQTLINKVINVMSHILYTTFRSNQKYNK